MAQNAGFAFQKLAFTLLRRSDDLLQSKLSIGYAQYKLLEVLKEYPNSSQRFVAATLMQTEASISRQVKLMQKAGLLRVGTPSNNKRVRVISLSTKGDEVHARAAQILNDYHMPLFERLSPAQQETFGEALLVLYDDVYRRYKTDRP